MMARGIGTVLLAIILEFAEALAFRAQSLLPRPEAPFKGVIKRTAGDSILDFPKGVEAPPAPRGSSWTLVQLRTLPTAERLPECSCDTTRQTI
jgi:hypothetical protein